MPTWPSLHIGTCPCDRCNPDFYETVLEGPLWSDGDGIEFEVVQNQDGEIYARDRRERDW